MLAIASYYRESIELRNLHRARVVLCRVPGDPPFFKYSWFENHNYILDLETILERCVGLDYLLIHIPAYAVDVVVEWLASVSQRLLKKVRNIHLNVLLMNIDNIQGKNVSGLKRFGNVTCTTVHEAYTNLTVRRTLDVPLHRLSVPLGPERYPISKYEDKEPLLIVSPDAHPRRDEILNHIAQTCPDLTIKVIANLSYEEYGRLIQRAKWSLTFGEGLDGYFVEPVFSGGISFAVFNDRYFTPHFSALETVYQSWDILKESITTDMRRLDQPSAYDERWRQVYDLLCSLYSTEQFRENLRLFYRGEYTFP